MKLFRALLLAASLVGLSTDATAAKISLAAEVAAHKWKGVRLRGLQKGGSLAVRIEASGPLVVLLVHESEIRKFPAGVKPSFAGSLERRLSFRLAVPLSGSYYVILDNRKGAEKRSLRLLIEALPARPLKPPSPPPGKPGLDAT